MSEKQISVRDYEKADVPHILNVLARSFPEYWAPLVSAGRTELAYGAESVVALCEGKIVGNCGMVKTPLLLNGLEVVAAGICSVAVDPDYRGLGIAQKMLRRTIDNALGGGAFFSPLFTDKPAVYAKLSWEPCRMRETFRVSSSILSPAISDVEIINGVPSQEQLKKLMDIYERGFPVFDGKILRSEEYWKKRVMPNVKDKAVWLIKHQNGVPTAYSLLCKTSSGGKFVAEAFSLIDSLPLFHELLQSSLSEAGGNLILALSGKHPFVEISEDKKMISGKGPDVYGEELMMNYLDRQNQKCELLLKSIANNDFCWPYPDKF